MMVIRDRGPKLLSNIVELNFMGKKKTIILRELILELLFRGLSELTLDIHLEMLLSFEVMRKKNIFKLRIITSLDTHDIRARSYFIIFKNLNMFPLRSSILTLYFPKFYYFV